jgi:exodeoxyribonuclease V alpha subunit
MIDIYLLNDFLNITQEINCTLVFLGDNRQLPSVGPGCILDKLISCPIFKITELIHVVRNGGNITKILDKVIDGENITISDCDDKKEFIWIEPKPEGEQSLLLDTININSSNTVIAITNNLIEQVTDNIREIKNPQSKSNPIDEYIKYPRTNSKKNIKIIYRVGDPVIHSKNNNKESLANGTQGIISKIIFENDDKLKPKIVQVKYKKNYKHKIDDDSKNNIENTNCDFLDKDDRIVDYEVDSDMINYLFPAYMITAHKSQGQEYENIIVVLNKSRLLNRNILYTALSRAQKSIILISSKENLEKCKRKVKRNSLLDYMFTYYNSEYDNDFCTYYLELSNDNTQKSQPDDNYQLIQCNGQNYVYNKETYEVFLYDDNVIGKSYGMYNKYTNKINKHKL